MKIVTSVAAVLGILLVALGSDPSHFRGSGAQALAAPEASPVTVAAKTAPAPATVLSASEATKVVQRTCIACHNDVALTQGLTLQSFDVAKADQNMAVAEKMVKKLRAGFMPPPVAPYKPGGDTLQALAGALETVLDNAAKKNPNPGYRTFPRLNRTEYSLAIRELLDLDVDAGDWLPQDPKSANFDNIADAQILSPLVLDSYMNAASDISRWAVGDRNAAPKKRTWILSDYVSQHPWDHVEGAPYGTRAGLVESHVFPADGYYTFTMTFGLAGNNSRLEDVDVSIDGERVALLHFERYFVRGLDADGRCSGQCGGMATEPIFVRAGEHKISAAFVRQGEGPYEDLVRPHEWSMAGGASGANGAVTMLTHMRDLTVDGPTGITGVSDTPSRKRVFSCRPTVSAEERSCAQQIVTRLATEAYRRQATAEDVAGVMTFYDQGAQKEGFEGGVRMALEAILSNPNFYFRLEREPEGVRPGRNYELGDVELASRLSFFLWGTPPDSELLDLARQGKLTDKRVLEQQTRRMLADQRSEALGKRFAGQWLRLQDLYKVHPDPNFYPNFDENLAEAMEKETELLFNDFVREDRPMLELLTADFTYVNDRLARHYGFPNVAGSSFRKVQYPDATRRGILGHGSILVLTSIANRTSPVLRGKYVMEVLLGTPPPPPPPGVPPLDVSTGQANAGKVLTTRERMELHRANDPCRSCHKFMDPIGLVLDNFDVTGRFRYRENGASLDTRGELYDGTPITNSQELVAALLKRPLPLVRGFSENMLTYALGRHLEPYDMPAVRAIAKEAEASGYKVSSFILAVVKSDAFQMKQAAAATSSSSNR
jgi:hypothetical protein